MKTLVQREPFDVGAETRELRKAKFGIGAVVTFVGQVRGDDGLTAMTLEHYPEVTMPTIAEMVVEAILRWKNAKDFTVIHRYGRLEVGEEIVFVGVAASHRRDAFEAAAFLMDQLKTSAPFWKKEHRPSGDRWVEAKAEDDEAAARWWDAAAI